MKNLHLSLRGSLGFLGLAPFFLIALGSMVFGSSFDSAAVSFLEESHLSISDEARTALLLCISNDRKATGWTVEVESDDTVYSIEVISIPRAQIKSAQNSNNNSAMRRSLSRATLRLAVYLDNGRLDRKRFSNYEAANYALLMSYFALLIVVISVASSAFALSDKEYKQMMKNAGFAKADKVLNQAWKNAKNSLSSRDFETLKRDQMSWIKSGRDNEAKLLLKRMSRVQAYTSVTNSRAEFINAYVRGIVSSGKSDIATDIAEEVNDDLPSDVPDDLPEFSPSDTAQKSSVRGSETIELSSPEGASEFLEEKLIELEKIRPSESLEYLDSSVDINGEICWEFSATLTFGKQAATLFLQAGKSMSMTEKSMYPSISRKMEF